MSLNFSNGRNARQSGFVRTRVSPEIEQGRRRRQRVAGLKVLPELRDLMARDRQMELSLGDLEPIRVNEPGLRPQVSDGVSKPYARGVAAGEGIATTATWGALQALGETRPYDNEGSNTAFTNIGFFGALDQSTIRNCDKYSLHFREQILKLARHGIGIFPDIFFQSGNRVLLVEVKQRRDSSPFLIPLMQFEAYKVVKQYLERAGFNVDVYYSLCAHQFNNTAAFAQSKTRHQDQLLLNEFASNISWLAIIPQDLTGHLLNMSAGWGTRLSIPTSASKGTQLRELGGPIAELHSALLSSVLCGSLTQPEARAKYVERLRSLGYADGPIESAITARKGKCTFLKMQVPTLSSATTGDLFDFNKEPTHSSAKSIVVDLPCISLLGGKASPLSEFLEWRRYSPLSTAQVKERLHKLKVISRWSKGGRRSPFTQLEFPSEITDSQNPF